MADSDRTRIKLAVYVDLDPTSGAFHSADSARNVLSRWLNDWLQLANNPIVSVESYDTSKQHGEPPLQSEIVISAYRMGYEDRSHEKDYDPSEALNLIEGNN